MKHYLFLMALFFALALGGAGGQESDEESDPQEAAARADDGDAAEETAPATADDVFVPSERISADQEVIFPVDI